MVYTMNQDGEKWENQIAPFIAKYRKKEMAIKVKVSVKNDKKRQKSTGEKTRIEGISRFTAYEYYSGLVNQAGLTIKEKDYFVINENSIDKIKYLLED